MTDIEGADPENTTVTEDELLGTHKYENVLYTGDTNLVDVMTEQPPAYTGRDVDEILEEIENGEFNDPPRVAARLPTEVQFERQCSAAKTVFYHRKVVGSLNWMYAFRAAVENDTYSVSMDPDYDTGTLTITVTKNESNPD